MKKLLQFLLALVAFSGAALSAQDLSGTWQGTLMAGGNLRTVLKIAKVDSGGWSAVMYSIDQGGAAIPVTSITLDGTSLKFSIDPLGGKYEGVLSADATAITGTWAQGGGAPHALNLARPTKETAWDVPDPAKGHTQIAVDAKVLDRYAGKYQLGPAMLSATHVGDHLVLMPPGGGRPLELFPESQTDFFAKVAPIQLSFHTDDHGNVIEFVLHQGGADRPAKRIVELDADTLKARCKDIDTMVAAAFARQPFGSVTVGIVSGDQLLWTRSYGNADMEQKLPADKDTIYRIGSVTKMFTALMLEQLADAGKVHLSDPVEKYFPEVSTVLDRHVDAAPITLMELATHTSGLGREPDNTATYVKGPVADWEKTLIAALAHTHYILEPGTRFAYSNIGYATLGAALGRAAGQPYVEYVPQHIFTPLGMTHTYLDTTPEMLPRLSKGYDVTGSQADAKTSQRELAGRGYKVPNGAIFTTVGDLAHFASFLMGKGPDSVLKASSLERYQTQLEVPADFNLSDGYGIGFEVMRRDNYIAFGHGGDVSGYQAALYMNRSAGVGVILLSNAIGNGALSTDDLALRSLDLLSK
jgi:CubicO group peptidase (beta-lactamase class C family)